MVPGGTVPGPNVEALFASNGGFASCRLESFRLARGDRLHVGRISALLAAVTWFPLLVLAALQGVAWGTAVQVPFLRDFLPYGQLLIAVPVLVFGELVVRRYLIAAVTELRTSPVLAPDDAPKLDALLERTGKLWCGRDINLMLAVVTCSATLVSVWGARDWLTGGWQVAGSGMTLAGWWYLLISLPVMRFLALRWLWRIVVWAWFLWRVAGLDLHPRPTHPDRAGGLAFLGGTQAVFSVFFFAFGIQLSCLVADRITFQGADLMAFRGQLAVFVGVAVGTLMIPLSVFAPQLLRARQDELLFMSGTGFRGGIDLKQKLAMDGAVALPTDAVSGLTDFGSLYENVRLMRPIPVELQHVVAIVLAAVLPFLPLIFLVVPAQQVLSTLAKLLI